MGGLVYGIIEAPHAGWLSGRSLLTFGGAALALGLFAWRELSARHPMLDLRFFADRRFSVASGGMTLVFFAMFGTFFLAAQYLQLVLGYSALESGLFQLPMAALMMVVSPQVPGFVARFGARRIVPAGLGFISLGLMLFSLMGTDTQIWWMYAPILTLALGMALTMTPLTTLIMSAVPMRQAGVGSAMNDTTRELGGALGVAVLGALVTSSYASSLGDSVANLSASDRAVVESGLTGALAVAGRLGEGGAVVVDAAKQAFVDGLGVAAIVGAAAVALAAIASARLLPHHGEAVDPIPHLAGAAGEVVEDAAPAVV